MADRKYSAEHNRGYDDALNGCPPDYGQATTAETMDYIAGYRKGRRERAQSKKEARCDSTTS